LRVLCSKIRLEGSFDFQTLAKATPGYVGADLSSLTGAAGVIAVKRIFKELSEGKIVIPDLVKTVRSEDVDMNIEKQEATEAARPSPFANLSIPSLAHSSIAQFLRAHPNPLTPEQLEPICITAADFALALKQVQPSAQREGFTTVPDVTWADIGALHATRGELHMAVVQPIKRPELFKAVGIDTSCGVLMWGPPGCGKTLLAKAVANESRANFISVKGPELLNKVCGTLCIRSLLSVI
jgi:ribosome biogenesis ATPase